MGISHMKEWAVGFAVSMALVAAGAAYGWTAPVMVRLMSNSSEIPMTEDEGSWVMASVDIGDIFTPIPAGIIADRFGRKPVMFSLVPLYIVGWIMIILTRSIGILIFARILLGFGMGIVYAVIPLYIGEISQPDVRGKISTFVFLMWYVGILMSYSIGPYVSYNMLCYVLLVVPVILAFTLSLIPESPYNLLSRGNFVAAKKSLGRLRSECDEFINNEIKKIEETIHDENSENKPINEVLKDPACKMSLFIFSVIIFTVYFGGMTVVFTYVTEIFSSSDDFSLDPDTCTIVLGVIYFILSIIAAVTVDRFGRKPLFLIYSAGCGICHFIAGSYFFIQKATFIDVSSHSWILMVAITGYCVFISVGMGPMTPVYQGEIFPNEIKGIASGAFTSLLSISSVSALKLFQIISTNISIYVAFWMMSLVNIFGLLIMSKFLVETKGKSLIEIQSDFRKLIRISN